MRERDIDPAFRGHSLTRRDLILTLGTVGGGLTLAGLRWLLGTPNIAVPQQNELEQNPNQLIGFIERQISAPFFTLSGHRGFAREALGIPEVRSTAAGLFNEVVQGEEEKGFGAVIADTVEAARRMLQAKYPQVSDQTLNIEGFHIATIALASVFTKFWTKWQDLEELFGFNRPPGHEREAKDFLWDPDEGIAFYRFPKLFGGEDRTVHATTSLFLTFEYFYSSFYNLGVHKEVPRFVNAYLKVVGALSKLEGVTRAQMFSELVGVLYEIRSTFTRGGLGSIKGRGISRGLLAGDLKEDLRANLLGAMVGRWAAWELLQEERSWADIKPTLLKLNERRLLRKDATPVFP